jgi:hypothetical protein
MVLCCLTIAGIAQAASNQNVEIFEYPGANSTGPTGINDRGIVVGQATGSGDDFGDSDFFDDEQVGFVYDGKKFYKIVIPGYDVLAAFGINNQGMITGLVENENGKRFGYVVRFPSDNVVQVE